MHVRTQLLSEGIHLTPRRYKWDKVDATHQLSGEIHLAPL